MISYMRRSKATDAEIETEEMVSFHNITNGGVDSMAQNCTTFSTRRRTRRWPLVIFYQLLNAASVNSCVPCTCTKKIAKIDPDVGLLKSLSFLL